MYPTKDDYLEAVDEFLAALSRVPGIDVHTNAVSTLIHGPYDHVMDTLKVLMLEADESGIFVLKVRPRGTGKVGDYDLEGRRPKGA